MLPSSVSSAFFTLPLSPLTLTLDLRFVICMASPKSCLSWEESPKDDVLHGPPNPWFDYYQYVPDSPTITVETDPNWGRELNTDDEEIAAMFDSQQQVDLFF